MTENFNETEIKRYLINKDPFIRVNLINLKSKESDSEKIEGLKSEMERIDGYLQPIDKRIQVFAQSVVDERGYKIYELPPELSNVFVWLNYEKLGWMDGPTIEEIEANNKDFIYRKALINTFRIEWLKYQISLLEASNTGTGSNTPKPGEATTATSKETKSDKLRAILTRYGFFGLKMTKDLSKDSQDKLISEIVKQGTPFAIALFQKLEYFSYLETEHFASKKQTNKNLAKWLDVTERTISGNRNVLNPMTTENKTRYTSHDYKENVKKLVKSL